jgi:23S rRNA (cytidine1920-2'-O)/16S rRNA (cytidine1409-2'-O)-methyltransferase
MVRVKSQKVRLDKFLFDSDFAESIESVRALIMSGRVLVNGQKIDKAGALIDADADIRIVGEEIKYVSRGGIKLEKAISEFNINVKDKIALDIGASTGGFTDCLLQSGAKKVYALDVGYGLLAWKLRNDPRIVNIEKTNIRYLDKSLIKEKADIITIDVSFISLTKVIPVIIDLLKLQGIIIALIKPQFELKRVDVGKGGIVKESEKHGKTIEKIRDFAINLGLEIKGVIESPILGQKGNREFLICLIKVDS